MLNRKTVIALVKSFARDVSAYGVKLREVYLYGSYAAGNQHKWSDVDVALVADEFSGFGFEDLKHFVKVHLQKKYTIIQTKTYSSDYFEKGDPFVNVIKRNGVKVSF